MDNTHLVYEAAQSPDWIKRLAWDMFYRHELVETAPAFFHALGVHDRSWREQQDAVDRFMHLPAAIPMPQILRTTLFQMGLIPIREAFLHKYSGVGPSVFPGRCEHCGAATKGGRYAPGHDAKLYGELWHEGTLDAMAELVIRGWAPDPSDPHITQLLHDPSLFMRRRVAARLGFEPHTHDPNGDVHQHPEMAGLTTGPKMCCKDGMTAEDHRHQTFDGRCCTDSPPTLDEG